MRRIYKKIAVVLIIVASSCELYLAGDIIAFSMINRTPQSDVAIVLGAAVWKNTPSPVFEERIKHAIALYRQGIVAKLLFTGGVGNGKQYAESEVARNYALKRGVNSSDILIETVSKTTLQNLLEAQRLLKSHALHSAILISDPLHMSRAMVMAEDIGLSVASSPTSTSRYRTLRTQAMFLLREMYFYQQYLFTGA
ncbi:YdcF family protein [Candidatus Electrothrix sp.]|uniref:YdcF family protein n=1 Tax=Candidatus Electrothrix sp. TaxID=2170559 RepID=UPI004056ECDA